MRRLGWWLVVLGGASITLLGAATPTGAAAGVLVALLAAGAVHLLFGSCGGRPGLTEVATALDELGVQVSALRVGDRQPAGAFLVHAIDTEGRRSLSRSTAVTPTTASCWQDCGGRCGTDRSGAPATLSRLQQAEHEAFLSLLARQEGVPLKRS